MAKILEKDPFTYEKERDSFLTGLKQFHTSRGTSFIRQPSIGGKEVDLFLLHNRVDVLGGYDKVNNLALWEDLVEYFGIPKYCTNGAQAIKQFYQRYLYLYEKVSKGEDPDQRDESEEPSAKRLKLKQFFSNVPTKYDHQQHIVADTVRRNLGLSTDFCRKEPYDKLEKALLSGLPNEVDFAVNVCTLLSNEGKHSLNVTKSPKLIEILLAHVGIFRDGAGSLFTLHHDGWRPRTKRNFERFWIDSVEDKEVRELLSPRSLSGNEKDEKVSKPGLLGDTSVYEELRNCVLHTGRDLGVHDVEGQRILQLAMIIRNLSFEEDNMALLASNLLVFRFLMLCIHSKYWTLKQLGLDTFGNLALKMELDPIDYPTTQLVLGVVTRCISSPDRFDVVRGLEVLARLCQVVNNWDLLSENLEHRVYEDIVNLLTVHDIQLIVFTLEALYHLSELGEIPSNHIAKVYASIDTLVHMVTIEAQAYGPNSLLGIKVVEHVPAGSVAQQHSGVAATSQSQNIVSQRQLHMPNRTGTPQRPQGAPTPPRPHAITTPQNHRPGAGLTPPHRQGLPTPSPFRQGTTGTAQSHRPGAVNTALPRPGISPYQRSPMSTQPVHQTMGPQGTVRPQLASSYLQRGVVNRARSRTQTVNQAECDAIAVAWLNAYYECVPGSVAVKNEVYAEYLATCSRYAIKNALNSTGFSDCIKVAFPHITHQRIERDDGTLEMQLLGIMRRPTPHAFPPPPKRVVTGYVSTPGGVRPVVYGTPNSGVISQPNVHAPQVHRPVIPIQQPVTANTAVSAKPQHAIEGTVVFSAQGLPPAQPTQVAVVTPLQTPALSAAQPTMPVAQPSQNQVPQESMTLNTTCTQQDDSKMSTSNQHEACLPVNRPPSRRRSCSGSSTHGSPPRSPIRPTRTRSPKSPRSKSPKSPRPISPKGSQSKVSSHAEMDINSDTSHAQMERIGEDMRVPLPETAIEKVVNPCLKIITDQGDHEKPNTRRKSVESRTNQNGSVGKLNGGSTGIVCTSIDMASSRTVDESHIRSDALHMNGDVLSPAPSDSSTATSDPMSPKRNGSNPTTSPSILDKKAKIAQLIKDTTVAKEKLGLGQNGIVPHLGNGDCVADEDTDRTSQVDLPTAEGLTKQMTEATALMPETNGCDDNLLSNSTDGTNDLVCDDMLLCYSTDGTNDNLKDDSETSSTSTVAIVTMSHSEGESSVSQTVITAVQPSQHQGIVGHTPATLSSLELENQINTQVDSRNTEAQNSNSTSNAVISATGNSFQAEKPGSAAIAELLQKKLMSSSQQHGQVSVVNSTAANCDPTISTQQQVLRLSLVAPGSSVVSVRPTFQANQPPQQSHLIQQLQQRLQRPNPNTQIQQQGQSYSTQSSQVCQASQSQLQAPGAETLGTNDFTVSQVGGTSVTTVMTTHSAVQQQLLQRLKAPQVFPNQAQQQSILQQRLVPPQAISAAQSIPPQIQNLQSFATEAQVPGRPSSTGPPSRPPSRPPSAGPQVRPPSTGPAPLPSPSASSDASTLPPASPPPGGQQPGRRPSTASTTSTDSKAAGTVKGKKRKAKSNSIESRRSSNASNSSEIQYMCQWNDCNTYFETTKGVSAHVVKEHVSQLPPQGLCPWETCDGIRRGKWSLMTHVQDRHLTEAALKASALRRQQASNTPSTQSSEKTNTNNTSSSSSASYPQDAALQAIRRFAPRPPYPELGEMKEGPVTKHIRLTSALILRNIAKYSSFGRSLLKRHESHLACMALSAVEASTALSHVLAELEHHALTSPAAKPESDGEEADCSDEDSDSENEAEGGEAVDTTDLDVSMTSQEAVVH